MEMVDFATFATPREDVDKKGNTFAVESFTDVSNQLIW